MKNPRVSKRKKILKIRAEIDAKATKEPIEPSVSYQSLSGGRGAGKPLPGRRSKRWDVYIGFPSLAFPFGERGYLGSPFDMDHHCPYGLYCSLLPW